MDVKDDEAKAKVAARLLEELDPKVRTDGAVKLLMTAEEAKARGLIPVTARELEWLRSNPTPDQVKKWAARRMREAGNRKQRRAKAAEAKREARRLQRAAARKSLHATEFVGRRVEPLLAPEFAPVVEATP